MFTRQDYLAGKCTHSEYYAQFVTDAVRNRVRDKIGIERLSRSTDPHLNDINLKQWDGLGFQLPYDVDALKQANDHISMAGKVCILKEAARQLIAEAV